MRILIVFVIFFNFLSAELRTVYVTDKNDYEDSHHEKFEKIKIVSEYQNNKKNGEEKVYGCDHVDSDNCEKLLSINHHKNNKYHGLCTDFIELPSQNLIIKREIMVKNGKRDGISKMYHDNSILSREEGYKDDKRHGYSRTYDRNGNIIRSRLYINGKKFGIYFDELFPILKEFYMHIIALISFIVLIKLVVKSWIIAILITIWTPFLLIVTSVLISPNPDPVGHGLAMMGIIATFVFATFVTMPMWLFYRKK